MPDMHADESDLNRLLHRPAVVAIRVTFRTIMEALARRGLVVAGRSTDVDRRVTRCGTLWTAPRHLPGCAVERAYVDKGCCYRFRRNPGMSSVAQLRFVIFGLGLLRPRCGGALAPAESDRASNALTVISIFFK